MISFLRTIGRTFSELTSSMFAFVLFDLLCTSGLFAWFGWIFDYNVTILHYISPMIFTFPTMFTCILFSAVNYIAETLKWL